MKERLHLKVRLHSALFGLSSLPPDKRSSCRHSFSGKYLHPTWGERGHVCLWNSCWLCLHEVIWCGSYTSSSTVPSFWSLASPHDALTYELCVFYSRLLWYFPSEIFGSMCPRLLANEVIMWDGESRIKLSNSVCSSVFSLCLFFLPGLHEAG